MQRHAIAHRRHSVLPNAEIEIALAEIGRRDISTIIQIRTYTAREIRTPSNQIAEVRCH